MRTILFVDSKRLIWNHCLNRQVQIHGSKRVPYLTGLTKVKNCSENLISSPLSTQNGIILVFTKTDLLEEAVFGSDTSGYFAEFPILSSSDDISLIKDGISSMFSIEMMRHVLNYRVFANLTDTHEMKLIFGEIKRKIMAYHNSLLCY